MNVRPLGALMVVVSSTVWGWQVASRVEARPRELRALMHLLEVLETDIAYAAIPLPQALRRAERTIAEPAATLARVAAVGLAGPAPVAEVWQNAIQKASASSALSLADWAAVRELGDVLGASGRDDQIRHLRLAHARLGEAVGPAEAEARRLGRVWRALGLFGGLGVALALY